MPRRLTLRELEADERVESASLDISPEVAILAEQKLVVVDPNAGEPSYEPSVAADRRVIATLTALEVWDGVQPTQAPVVAG